MKCPYCGHAEDRVVDSRESREGAMIRRRRECLDCGKRFTSHETVEEIPCMVIKKHGRRETYDREKVVSGLRRACGARVAEEKMAEIADQVTARVADTPDREMRSSEVGELVMDALKGLDHVAFVRFASVYRDFQDTQDFVKEVRSLIRKRSARPKKRTRSARP